MTGPGHHHQSPAVGQPVTQHLGPVHADRRVLGAVQDDGRGADLAQPVGEVVAVHEAPVEDGEVRPREGRPLGHPGGGVATRTQDDRRRRVLDVTWAVGQPFFVHGVVGGDGVGQLLAGLAVDKDQAPDPSGGHQGGPAGR